MKILVTGASGLLGSGVARALAARGDQVTVLQRRPAGLGLPEVLADVAILPDASEIEGAAARTIRLRSEPDPASARDQSIYRYDRAGLLMALKTAGGRA